MARATRKAAPSRPKKAAPANRGHGAKGVAKYDPDKHPRGPDGRFLSKGGATKTPKARTKTTRKTTKAATKAPKPPRKVGTPKQRKGLADQIRAERAKARTPEGRKALLGQVRALRAKRAEWKRGQGKTQVESLPKPPKEKTPKTAKEPKPAKAKPVASKSAKQPAKPASQPELRSHYESLKDLPDAQKRQAVLAFVEKHQTPAVPVQVHGMSHPEEMHSIEFDGYKLHYPKGETERVMRTLRGSELYGPMPAELARHTKNVYLSTQANKNHNYWNQKYNMPGFTATATGGSGGNVVFYNGHGIDSGTLAHEMGHNLATARYGMIKPGEFSKFMEATRSEKPPTSYATKSDSEDFAESAMMYVKTGKRFQQSHPKRYKVIDRMLKDPNYAG